jgi:hypothetical protein
MFTFHPSEICDQNLVSKILHFRAPQGSITRVCVAICRAFVAAAVLTHAPRMIAASTLAQACSDQWHI